MNIKNIINGIKNPRQEVINMAKGIDNPILKNMLNLAEQGKNKELEQIARNIFKEKGVNFDKEIAPYLPRK